MASPTSRGAKIKRGLRILWLALVAGLPLYYLMPDRDWNYEDWGAPEQIIISRMRWNHPHHQDEATAHTRVFIVRPSAENLSRFGKTSDKGRCRYPMDELLNQYELPAPWRYGSWSDHGWMDFVVCGNGLLLLEDYSRNKGGLFSSRMSWDTVMEHYPLHFRIMYCWASLGLLLLLLTPFLAIPAAVCYLIFRVARAFWRIR